MSKIVFARGSLKIKTVRSVDEITDQLITALEHLDVEVQYEKEGTFRFQIPLVKIAIKYNNTRAYPLQGFSSGNIQVVAIRPDYLKIVYQLETEYTFLRSVLIPFLIISFLTSFLSLPLSDIFSTLPFWQIILMGFPLAMILFFALAYMNKKEGIRVFQILIKNSLIQKLYVTWPRTEFYAADKSFTLLMMIFGISAYVCVINPLVQKLYTAIGNELYWIGLLIVLLLAPLFYGVRFLGAVSWLFLSKSKYPPAFQRAVLKHKRYPKWMRKILEKWFALNQPEKVV